MILEALLLFCTAAAVFFALVSLQHWLLKPQLCASCGRRPADPPSSLCPGCEAYQEHQR